MKLDQSNGAENGGDLHSPHRPASPQKRRTGKVARLPRKLRDLINDLLSEGLTYTEIIQRLKESSDPPLPYDISERNLSNWHTGGFQDWERHQDRMDLMATKFDFAMDLAQTTEPHKLQELSLQLAAVRMCEFLSDLAIADPQTDPLIYLRLLSALPRIARESLNLQKYRDTASQQVGTLSTASPSLNSQRPPQNPPTPIIDEARSEAIRTALLDKLDDIMGFKSYRNLPRTPFDPSKLPPYMHIAPGALPPEAYGNLQTPPTPGVLPSPAAATSEPPPAIPSTTPGVPHSPAAATPEPVPAASNPIKNQKSEINNSETPPPPTEFCRECKYPMPPLLPTGKRPNHWCANCGTPLPPPPTEACGHLRTPTSAPGVPTSPAAATSKPVPAASD